MAADPVARWDALARPLASLPRPLARVALVLLAAALAWSAFAIPPFELPTAGVAPAGASRDIGDVELYVRINARMHAGQDYYSAAVAEQQANDYPTRPFVTVRTPVLAWGDAVWGQAGWRAIAILLLAGNVIAWNLALAIRANLAERAGAAVLLVLAGLAALIGPVGFAHDLVAGLCLSLALALYRPDRWWPTWLLAAAGLGARELAAPFALLWLAWALVRRHWREAAAVAGLIALFAVAMALHAHAVALADGGTGKHAPDWLGMQGPGVVLSGLWKFSALQALPRALAGPVALLALVGWIGLGGRNALLAVLWLLGMTLGFSIVARPTGDYWAQMLLPLWPGGLAFAPRALADLAGAASSKT